MSIKVMSYVWEHSQQAGSDLLTLLAIADHADDKGTAFPSVRRLAEKTRMSQRNVQYILKKLEETGELKIKKNQGLKRTNLYQINLEALGQLEGAKFAPCNELHGATQRQKLPAEGAIAIAPEPSLREPSFKDPPPHTVCVAPPQGEAHTHTGRLRLFMPGEEKDQERLRASIVDAKFVAWQQRKYPSADIAAQWEFFVERCLARGLTYVSFRHAFMSSFVWENSPAGRARESPRERQSPEARQRAMQDWVKAKEEEEKHDPDRVI